MKGLILVLLAACGTTPEPREPLFATEAVVVRGERVSLLGERMTAVGDVVEVALHDGRVVRAPSGDVIPESIAIGTHVLVRWNTGQATLWEAEVVERLGDVLRVKFMSDQSVSLVALSDVIGVLSEPLTSPTPVTPTQTTETTPPPPVDPEREVVTLEDVAYVPARAVRCGGRLTVLRRDGSTADVDPADAVPARAAVGERVRAYFNSSETSYSAVVSAVDGDRISLRYDDGSEEDLGWADIQFVFRPTVQRGSAAVCSRLRGSQLPFVLVPRLRAARAGHIDDCEAGRARITRRDGTTEVVEAASLRRLRLAQGAFVDAPWGSTTYFATVMAVDGPSADVQYEDGSAGTATVADIARRYYALDDLPSETVACP